MPSLPPFTDIGSPWTANIISISAPFCVVALFAFLLKHDSWIWFLVGAAVCVVVGIMRSIIRGENE